MLKIGEFAKIFNVTIKTIRFYEEKELLNPCYIDKYSGYRYYDDENIKQMNQILYLIKLIQTMKRIRLKKIKQIIKTTKIITAMQIRRIKIQKLPVSWNLQMI